MATSHGCYEIVEAKEELDIQLEMSEKECIQHGHVYSIEDDINRLFQAIDIKTSVGEDTLQKNPMKRPMRVNASQASGIGISESVNLKQALRGLCLSQASEVAAMKRRSLRSAASSSAVSNVGAMKRLYRAVIVEANDSGDSLDKGKSNSVEISLPGKMVPNHNSEVSETTNVSWSGSSNQVSDSSAVFPGSTAIKAKMARAPSPDKVVPLPSEAVDDIPTVELQREQKLKLMQSKRRVCTIKKVLEQGDMFPTKGVLKKSVQQVKQLNDESHSKSYPNSSIDGSKMKKSHTNSLHIRNTVFRNKNFIKRKMKSVSISDSSSVPDKRNPRSDLLNSAGKPVSPIEESTCHDVSKASNRMPSTLGGKSESIGVFSSLLNPLVSKVDTTKVGDGAGVSIVRADERAKLRDKGEISQSSKSSSIGDFSCSTSNSEASSLSGFSRCGSRPHMSKDLRWDIVQRLQKQHGKLNLRHFQLLKRLGAGDIGTVYLAELVSTSSLFALKVMDNEFLAQRKKLVRAETEREILQMLDHPFLPTLYAHFTTDKLSCLVMEYCPGGDLHVLRQRQPCRCFSEKSARFYVAEVLLALEYLHMLGVVYRDLKPENVLVREDGHIMLSDFDLSLRCIVNPTIYRSSPNLYSPKKVSSPCLESSCIDPFCLQPSWQVSCFTPRLLAAASKSRKADQAAQVIPLPQLVAEPTDARSNSFVGTHEYLAPEIIKGVGHGSSVDWWTFGIFLYELLYGKTPFKGSSNEETLANVVSQPLKFPASPLVSFHARNLIKGLLIKEPENRLGFLKGAAEIKQHPFFEGLNWALIRCAQPPKRPRLYDNGLGGGPAGVSHKNQSCKSLECNSDHIEFELF